MAVTNQQVHSLVTYFLKLYGQKYEEAPRDFNRYRDKWGFQSMIEDFGPARAKQIVEFYLSTYPPRHPVKKQNLKYYKFKKFYQNGQAER